MARPELGTASGLQRAVACPASTVLPRVDRESPEASRGTVLHEYLAAVTRLGGNKEEALAWVAKAYPEDAAACESIPLESLPAGAGWRAEVAFAYDLDTGKGRELGEALGRAYVTGPSEIPGTTDLVHVDGHTAWVADYKTGHGYVPPAQRNLQLLFLALAVCRAYGVHHARVAIIRVREDGEPWYDEAALGPFELSEIEDQLQQARAAAKVQKAQLEAGKPVDVRTGRHCDYCPAMPHCPAFLQVIGRMAVAPGDVAQEIQAQLTPELAARAYQNLRMAKDALQLVESALRAQAQEEPIPVGDGLVYGLVEGVRKELDGDKTHLVLEQLYGRAVADAGVERSASQASIKRALAPLRAAKKIKAVAPELERVLVQLREVEGIDERPTYTLKEHKPKPSERPASLPEGAPAAEASP